jgi:predicted DsbA family dithiol-disulfide isomerase
MEAQPEVRIDVWSDYVCPYCYLEVPVVDRLQESFGPALEITWRAFELRPEPLPTLEPAGTYLHTAWTQSVYPMAERRGMTLHLPPVQPRSRKALEAAVHSRHEGLFDPVHRAIFHAFFKEGKDIGEMNVLLEIAASAGLQRDPLRQALEESRHAGQLFRDQQLAHDLGISAVPTMVVRRAGAPWQEAVAIRGAQPYEQVHAAVDALMSGEKLS